MSDCTVTGVGGAGDAAVRCWAPARLRAVAAPVLLVLLSACASAMPETPGARRTADIDELKARVTQLAQQAAVNEAEIVRLRQQVAALESRLGMTSRRDGAAPPPAPPRPPAPAAAAVAPPRPPPPAAARPTPAPRIEESDLTVEEVEVVPPPSRPAAPAQPAAAGRRPGAAAAPSRPATGEALGPVDREAQAIYDEAYTYFHQGRYDDAEARFQEFLAVSPSSELSDNAQYWIGASRFAKRDFRGALAAFRRTVEAYPDENKVPDALFKMGQALEELGERTEALTVYEDLVRRFPDTAAATLAAERQASLR